MVYRIPRESIEYLPVDVKLDGVLTDDYQISVVPWNERPDDWINAPYLIQGLDVGHYDAYIRIIDNPEIPVVHAGRFSVT